jgi:hypothetical protein
MRATAAAPPPPPQPLATPELQSRLEKAEAERQRTAETLEEREREMEAMRQRMRDLEYKAKVMEQHIMWQASGARGATTLNKNTQMAPVMGSDPYDDEPLYDTMSAKPLPNVAEDEEEVTYDMPLKSTAAAVACSIEEDRPYQELTGIPGRAAGHDSLGPPPPPRISLSQQQSTEEEDEEIIYDSVPLNLLASERAATTLQSIARGFMARRRYSVVRHQARQMANAVAGFCQFIERSSQVSFFLMSSCSRYDKDNRSKTVKTLKRNAKLRRKEAKAVSRRDTAESVDGEQRERASSIDSALSTSPAVKAADNIRARAQTAALMTRPSCQRTPPSSLSSASRTSSSASDYQPASPQRHQRDPLPPTPTEMSHASTLSKPPTLSRPPAALLSVSLQNSGGRRAAVEWYTEKERPRGAGLMADHRTPAPWFHGLISREAAEAVLATGEDGAFLVRLSESRHCYVISLRSANRSRHYMVEQNAAGKYGLLGREEHGVRILREPLHNSLMELIACFTRHRVNATQRLGSPCPRHNSSGLVDLVGGPGGVLRTAKAGCHVHSMRLDRGPASNSAV